MDRRTFLRNSTVVGLSGVGLNVKCMGLTLGTSPKATAKEAAIDAENGYDTHAAADRLTKVRAAALAMQRRDWEHGTLAQAFLEANDIEQVILLTKAAVVQREQDGRLAVVGEGGPTDPAMGGEAYFRAGQVTGDVALQQAAHGLLDWLLKGAPRAADGTLYHVFSRPEVWSDGLNGAPPFLAATGHYDEALRQIEGYKRRLWSPEKKLLTHIVSDGQADRQQEIRRPEYWGGGNGWAAVGVARVIRALPPGYESERKGLAGFVRDIVDGCMAHQRADGLFHNIVDRPETFVETNLAQMLAFAIYIGLRGGWLPTSYLQAANLMRSAATGKVDTFGFVQGVCGAPGFDRPGISTEGQAFFMMMEAAAKLA